MTRIVNETEMLPSVKGFNDTTVSIHIAGAGGAGNVGLNSKSFPNSSDLYPLYDFPSTEYRFDTPRRCWRLDGTRELNEDTYWYKYHAKVNRVSFLILIAFVLVFIGFYDSGFQYFDGINFIKNLIGIVLATLTSIASVLIWDVIRAMARSFYDWITVADT